MPLVYVTGGSGVGKSAVCGELRRRGYDAIIVDATPPPSKVVDNLLTALDLPT
jgi:predicted ATPase